MSKQNFKIMTKKELHNYVLANHEDKEAFHAYVDKLNAEGNWVEMPPLQSIEDLENNPELIELFRNKSEQ